MSYNVLNSQDYLTRLRSYLTPNQKTMNQKLLWDKILLK